MNRFVEWIKLDYARVTSEWKEIFNEKAPEWAPSAMYALLFPIGLVLTPIAYILVRLYIYRLTH